MAGPAGPLNTMVLTATANLSVVAALADLGDVSSPPTGAERLRAVYYDADDYLLARLGVTVTRRCGGHDAGWDLTVPSGGRRIEHHHPLGGTAPPEELRRLVEPVLAGRALRAVATIDTLRRRHVLAGASGAAVLEVVEDAMDAARHDDHQVVVDIRWSELEVELGAAGQERDLRRVAKRLRGAGAQAGPTSIALHRVLGLDADDAPDALSVFLRTQCARILLGEIGLRQHADAEQVHDARVGVRRLRSVLRVFDDLHDSRSPAEVDADLRWYAGLLGDVRDADVLREQVLQELGRLPVELVMGPIAQEVETALAETRAGALRRRDEATSTQRYADVVRLVGDWLVEPPVRADVTDAVLRKDGWVLLKKARKKLDRRLAAAGDDIGAMHGARKAAKRLRYAATALQPARPQAKRAKQRARAEQNALGHHQDLVVRIDFLRAQAARFGGQSGHNGFTYGQLRGAAEAEAAQLRKERS